MCQSDNSLWTIIHSRGDKACATKRLLNLHWAHQQWSSTLRTSSQSLQYLVRMETCQHTWLDMACVELSLSCIRVYSDPFIWPVCCAWGLSLTQQGVQVSSFTPNPIRPLVSELQWMQCLVLWGSNLRVYRGLAGLACIIQISSVWIWELEC